MTQDKAVALFELEMSAEQLVFRILSSLGQIDGFKIRTGNLWAGCGDEMTGL